MSTLAAATYAATTKNHVDGHGYGFNGGDCLGVYGWTIDYQYCKLYYKFLESNYDHFLGRLAMAIYSS